MLIWISIRALRTIADHMTEEELSQSALEAIESGSFSLAREKYGQLLEAYPENPEYACGLYTAGYWQNRDDILQGQDRSGRVRGAQLLSMWDKFQSIASRREYPGYFSFRAAMRYILGLAAEQYRKAFQDEGGGSVDLDMLLELSVTLIRIGNYRDAQDILAYARRVSRPDARILFLSGEARACLSDEEDPAALSLFRDGFFLRPEALDPSLLSSSTVTGVFQELLEEFAGDMDRVYLWLPAYFHLKCLLPGLRKLHNDEVEQLFWECERLEKDINNEKYSEKIRSRLAFYYIALIYYFTHNEVDRSVVADLKTRLGQADTDILDKLKKRLAS